MGGYTKQNLTRSRTRRPTSGSLTSSRRALRAGLSRARSWDSACSGSLPTSGSRSATSTSARRRSTSSTSGSARIKVEDEIVELGQWDAIRIDKDTMRDVEAGPDGVEYLAFGAGDDPSEVEMAQGWWTD